MGLWWELCGFYGVGGGAEGLCFDEGADFVVAIDVGEGQRYTGYAVENPEAVGRGVVVDDHMAAYLRRVKGEPPDFYQADGFECYYVEYVDVEGHDAAVGQESPGYASTVGQPEGYAVKYEEAGKSGQWEGQHVNHLRGEIHPFPVVKRAYTQKSYEEEELPYPERVS